MLPLEESVVDCTYSTTIKTDRSGEAKIPSFVYVNAVCASLNALNVGFDIGVNTPAALLLQQDLDLSDFQLEWFLGCLNFFALWGALGSTYVVQRFGMRMSFVVASVLFLVGLVLMVSTWRSYLQLLLGRVLVGVGIGFGCTVTPQYLSETSPAASR